MPLTITPKPVRDPEIAFDKTLVTLAVSPVIKGKTIDANMAMVCTPYRVLADGSIEINEDLQQHFISGSVFEDALVDAALATAAARVWDAIQDFLTAKEA